MKNQLKIKEAKIQKMKKTRQCQKERTSGKAYERLLPHQSGCYLVGIPPLRKPLGNAESKTIPCANKARKE